MALELVYDLTLQTDPNAIGKVVLFPRSTDTNTGSITVNWGDGTPSDVFNYTQFPPETIGSYDPISLVETVSHTYVTQGIYTISILGSCDSFSTSYYIVGSSLEAHPTIRTLTQINNFGDGITFTCSKFKYGFYLAENLVSCPSTIPSTITNIYGMFRYCTQFNSPNISTWNTVNITDMGDLFSRCSSFNQDISNWNVLNVTNMYRMFSSSSFNSYIGGWITSSCTNMGSMFNSTPFNQNINGWDVHNVNDMSYMFGASLFNSPIDSWITSECVNMHSMFSGCFNFNQNISNWNTSKVTDMGSMFYDARVFNLNISNWNTSKVTNMSFMFYNALKFNQNINTNISSGTWITSACTDMSYMFAVASGGSGGTPIPEFDQNISDWDISNVITMQGMFNNALPIQRQYYDAMLTKWGQLPVKLGVPFHAGSSTQYTCDSTAEYYRDEVLNAPAPKGWIITDGGCYNAILDYYVDINQNTSTGTGTSASPYNRDQLSDILMDTSKLIDGNTYHIRGHLDIVSGTAYGNKFIKNLGNANPVYPVSITLRGWDIATNGCPIIRWSTINVSPGSRNKMWDCVFENISATVQDFILTTTNTLYDFLTMDNSTENYKNVCFVVNNLIGGFSNLRPDLSKNYYGCTFNCDTASFNYLGSLSFSDCVFDLSNFYANSNLSLITYNNVSTIPGEDFTDGITNTPLDLYVEPTYKEEIDSTPIISDFSQFIRYYTNNNAMYYKVYNVEDSTNSSLITYRNNNGYNTGLFNEPRLSYGAYSFLGVVPIEPEIDPTKGSIGSFYFGGDFDNVSVTSKNLAIDLIPVSSGKIVIDAYVMKYAKAIIDVFPVNTQYTIVKKDFLVDFVAKKRADAKYPKLCGCGSVTCTNIDREASSASIVGGNPLIVDFIACGVGVGDFASYTPVKYMWYFDYGNPSSASDSYLETTSPSATYTYCGSYLESHDVVLCVDFQNPTIY